MTKCQKEEKGFCKIQKHELQLLPAAGGWFNKNELELFVEDWPRRPPASPDASGLPAFPPLSSNFLLLFHFLHPVHFSFFADNFHAQPAAHPAQFLPAARTLRFHYFFVRSVLILSQAITPSSGASRPSFHPQHSYPSHPQARVSRSGLPATRFPHLFCSKQSQPFISRHTFFRR